MMDISGPDQERARRFNRAQEYLKSEGIRVLDVNWRSAEGTLDMVAEDRGTLVVIRVVDHIRAMGDQAVSRSRIKRQRRMAVAWMNAHGTSYARVRVDVVAVQLLPVGQSNLEHVRAVDGDL